MSDLFVNDRTPLMAHANNSHRRASATAFIYTEPSNTDISYKLSHRKDLLNRRLIIINLELFFAMIGFVGMLVVTELHIQRVYDHDHHIVLILKIIISVSTALLLLMIVLYYDTEVRLIMTEKNVEDWRVIVTWFFILKVFIQLIICSIHPIPGHIKVPYITIDDRTGKVSLDAMLSIMMLLRLYIVVKFLLMHTKWMSSTTMQSIGHLNRIETDAKFILRCVMKERPRTLVCVIMFAIFILNSWAMRTCESYYDPGNELSSISNSMWVVAITFVAVGYGDLSPNSYCGRLVSVDTGLMGIATTALLVTVITAKLEQTRAERYVHDFMAWVEMEKKKKIYASDIIKWSMMRWSLKGRRKITSRDKLRYQRKLNMALKKMHDVMRKLDIMRDNSFDIVELADAVNNAQEFADYFESKVEQAFNRRQVLDSRLKALENKLDELLNEMPTEDSIT